MPPIIAAIAPTALDSGSHHGLRSRLSATRFRNVRRQPSPVHWGRWTAWHPENRHRWPDRPLKRLQDKSQTLYPDIVAKLGPLATTRSWGYLSQVHTQFGHYRKRIVMKTLPPLSGNINGGRPSDQLRREADNGRFRRFGRAKN